MKCASCGKTIEPNSKFCTECGAPVTETKAEQTEITTCDAPTEQTPTEQTQPPAYVDDLTDWEFLSIDSKFNLLARLYLNKNSIPVLSPLVCEKICEMAKIYHKSDVSFKREHIEIYAMLAWAAEEADKAGDIKQAANARYMLGFLYYDKETGVIPDYANINTILMKLMDAAIQAENNGDTDTAGEIRFYIGNLYLNDDKSSVPDLKTVKDWWEKAEQNNCARAISGLSRLHFNYMQTPGFSRREGIRLLEKCAYELHIPDDMVRLAAMLNDGLGIPQDEYMAKRLAEQSADLYIKQGDIPPAELFYPLSEILHNAASGYWENTEYDRYADCQNNYIALLETAACSAVYLQQFNAAAGNDLAATLLTETLRNAKAEQESYIEYSTVTPSNPAEGYDTLNTAYMTADLENIRYDLEAKNKNDAAALDNLPKDTQLTDSSRRGYINNIEQRLNVLARAAKKLHYTEAELPQA